jgi:hypothetical protein
MNRGESSRVLKLTHEIADNQQGSPLLSFLYAKKIETEKNKVFIFLLFNRNVKIKKDKGQC